MNTTLLWIDLTLKITLIAGLAVCGLALIVAAAREWKRQ